MDFSIETARLAKQAAILEMEELALLVRHGLAPGQQVLELGCGQGKMAHAVAKAPGAGSITGIDVHPAFITSAVETYRLPNLVFREQSVYDLQGLPPSDFIYARLVFQHISHPEAALSQVRGNLRPGGRVCFIDVNDEWLFMEPSIPAFDQLIQSGMQLQKGLGGDRLVGKRLPLHLLAAGFTDLKIEILPFSSAMQGMRNFLEIAVSFRANQVPGGAALYDEVLRTVTARENAFHGMAGIFCISATAH